MCGVYKSTFPLGRFSNDIFQFSKETDRTRTTFEYDKNGDALWPKIKNISLSHQWGLLENIYIIEYLHIKQ